MYITLNNLQIADMIMQDEFSDFTYEQATAIATYLETIEESAETRMEFDMVVVRWSFEKYDSMEDIEADYDAFEIDVIEVADGSYLVSSL